jgi:hypothetical protein
MTPKQEAQGEAVPEREARGETAPEREGKGEAAPEREAQGETEREAQGETEPGETEPQTLDLTGLLRPSTIPYSIDRDREQKRGWIALILVGLLVVVILLSFAGLFTARIELKDLKELLIVILGPLVALVGAATGFYFGEKNKRDQ